MKTFFYFILFFLFIDEVKGQFSVAGMPGLIFVDIIPDTLLNPAVNSNENYYIDINQDSFNDIKISASIYASPGNTTMQVSINSLDTFTSFSFGSIDSTDLSSSPPCNGWLTRTILKIFNNGDTIKNGNYVSSGYLGFSTWFGSCGAGASSSQWVNSQDLFFGVKYQTTLDTSFGWVKVNVTQYQNVLIEEYSLGSPLSAINSIDVNNFITVYPNPANDKLQVSITNHAKATISLLNVYGREIKRTEQKEIDVSSLQEGIYFVQVKISEGILTRKIIVQH